MLIIRLFLASADCENHTESYTQQGCKEHTVLAWKHKRDGVGGVPEQWNGLLKYEAPLAVPVEGRDKAAHWDRLEECLNRASALCDMCIGNLVEGHKHGCKEGVHHHRD